MFSRRPQHRVVRLCTRTPVLSNDLPVPAPCNCNSTGRYGAVPSTYSRESFGTLTLPRSHSTSSLISSPSLTFACRLHQFALAHASQIAEAVVEQGRVLNVPSSNPPDASHSTDDTFFSRYCLPSVDSGHVVGACHRPTTNSCAAWRYPCTPEIDAMMERGRQGGCRSVRRLGIFCAENAP
jgi:hypothetical protein